MSLARARTALIGVACLAATMTVPITASAASSGHSSPVGHTAASAPVTKKIPRDSLRYLASKVGLRIGTAVNTDALASNAEYATITATQFSSVTPENVMKWEVVEPT